MTQVRGALMAAIVLWTAPLALVITAPTALADPGVVLSARGYGVSVPVTTRGADAQTADATDRSVRALIVQYRPGVSPRMGDGSLRGAQQVTGPLRTTLRLGPGLGLNMWRVDFTRPVTMAQARRVARQLASDPSIVMAEPDTPVSAARSS